jgi:hypothetical protein
LIADFHVLGLFIRKIHDRSEKKSVYHAASLLWYKICTTPKASPLRPRLLKMWLSRSFGTTEFWFFFFRIDFSCMQQIAYKMCIQNVHATFMHFVEQIENNTNSHWSWRCERSLHEPYYRIRLFGFVLHYRIYKISSFQFMNPNGFNQCLKTFWRITCYMYKKDKMLIVRKYSFVCFASTLHIAVTDETQEQIKIFIERIRCALFGSVNIFLIF